MKLTKNALVIGATILATACAEKTVEIANENDEKPLVQVELENTHDFYCRDGHCKHTKFDCVTEGLRYYNNAPQPQGHAYDRKANRFNATILRSEIRHANEK